jgi:hypothetical protein
LGYGGVRLPILTEFMFAALTVLSKIILKFLSETVLTGPMFISKTVPTILVCLTGTVLAVRKTFLSVLMFIYLTFLL